MYIKTFDGSVNGAPPTGGGGGGGEKQPAFGILERERISMPLQDLFVMSWSAASVLIA